MKKVTKLVTLFAAGLCALALIPNVVASTTGETAKAGLDYYGISTSAVDKMTGDVMFGDIEFDAPVVGKAGKVINFDLFYDTEHYGLFDLSVNNDITPARNSDGSFSFVMPNGRANVVAYFYDLTSDFMYSHAIFNGYEDLGVNIVYSDLSVISVQNGMAFAEPGVKVSFQFGFSLGTYVAYGGFCSIAPMVPGTGEYEGYYVADEDNAFVPNFNHTTGYYEFIMPVTPVMLIPELTYKGFVMSYDYDDENAFAKFETSVDGVTWEALEKPRLNATKPLGQFFVLSNEIVRITVANTSKAKVTGVKILGQTINVIPNTNYIMFQVPTSNFKVEPIYETLYRTITMNDDEMTNRYNWELYLSETSTGPFVKATEMKAVYGQYARLYPTLKNPADLKKINQIKFTMVGYTYSNLNSYTGTDEIGPYYALGAYNTVQAYDYVVQVMSEYSAKTLDLSYTTAHVSAKRVQKVNDQWVALNDNHTYYGDTVYVQFTVDSDDYGFTAPKLTSSSSNKDLTVEDAANNVYKATSLYDYDYTLTFEEVVAQFAGYEFVGTYQGFECYNMTTRTNVQYSSTYSISIDKFGTFTKSSSKFTLTADGDNTVKTGTGSFLTNGKKGVYGGNWVVTCWSPSSKDYIDSMSDLMINYKTQDYVSFDVNVGSASSDYVAVQALDASKNVISSMLVTKAGGVYLENVTFEFLNGTTTIGTTNASFKVMQGNTVVGVVNGRTFTPAN